MATRILVVDDSPTIRAVVSTILERHGYEPTLAIDGQDALEALESGEVAADLVLVDFVMPRMNGYQLCRALRQREALAHLPVVLMSAKADRIREQFVQQTGALDAITKPFDPQALVAVIENALRKVSQGYVSAAQLPDAGDEDDDGPDVAAASAPTSAEPVLAGDLGAIPIGAILQLLHGEDQTGILVCRSGVTEVRATFRAGAIDLVQSSGAGDEFRLGRYFIEEGILTAAELDAFAGGALASGPASVVQPRDRASRPLGMALVAAGKVTEADLRSALTRQSSELLYDVLRWPRGRFEVWREPPSELAEGARLAMPVAAVVMEGFRRVDEWRVLESKLGSFDAVLVRDELALGSVDAAGLPPRERAVLDAVDGARPLREIITASNVSSFDACRILVQLLEARLLRRRPA